MAETRNVTATIKRPPVNDRQVEMMLGVFIRLRQTFEAARTSLSVEGFADHHRIYALVWSIVCDHVDEFGELPDDNIIAGEIESRVDEDPSALSNEEMDTLELFLSMTFRIREEMLREQVALKFLRMYLDDRLVDRVRKEISGDFSTPEELLTMFSRYSELASEIDVMEHSGLERPFEAGWDDGDALKVEKVRSGLSFLDSMTGGGIALTEVLGLMGPHGSCKTTISIQLAVDLAERYYSDYLRTNCQGPLKFVYVFIYEGTINEMRLRALSHAATIDRTHLESGDSRELSTQDTLHEYERNQYRALLRYGFAIPGEIDRYKEYQGRMNHNLRFIDMTGNDKKFPGRGHGLAGEIAQIIRGDQEYLTRNGVQAEVGLVCVDYAGAAVERHLDHNNLSHDKHLRYTLGKLPMHLKNKVAIAYNTVVLCLHQLSGQANSLKAGVVAKGTDAAEAKSFRENLDFLMIISNLNDDGRGVVNMDKHRRAGASRQEVIEVHGLFSRVKGTDNHWVFDNKSGKIVERDSLHQLQEVPEESGDDNSGYDPGRGLPTNDDDPMDDETAQISGSTSEANP